MFEVWKSAGLLTGYEYFLENKFLLGDMYIICIMYCMWLIFLPKTSFSLFFCTFCYLTWQVRFSCHRNMAFHPLYDDIIAFQSDVSAGITLCILSFGGIAASLKSDLPSDTVSLCMKVSRQKVRNSECALELWRMLGSWANQMSTFSNVCLHFFTTSVWNLDLSNTNISSIEQPFELVSWC